MNNSLHFSLYAIRFRFSQSNYILPTFSLEDSIMWNNYVKFCASGVIVLLKVQSKLSLLVLLLYNLYSALACLCFFNFIFFKVIFLLFVIVVALLFMMCHDQVRAYFRINTMTTYKNVFRHICKYKTTAYLHDVISWWWDLVFTWNHCDYVFIVDLVCQENGNLC